MQAAHISNLQRGVVPNVLDSLCLGLSPERRVKEASINPFKAAVAAREMRCASGKVETETGSGEVAISAPPPAQPRLCMNTVDLSHQTKDRRRGVWEAAAC